MMLFILIFHPIFVLWMNIPLFTKNLSQAIERKNKTLYKLIKRCKSKIYIRVEIWLFYWDLEIII